MCSFCTGPKPGVPDSGGVKKSEMEKGIPCASVVATMDMSVNYIPPFQDSWSATGCSHLGDSAERAAQAVI